MVLRSFEGDAPADAADAADAADGGGKGGDGGGLVLAATTASTGYAPSILKDVTKVHSINNDYHSINNDYHSINNDYHSINTD